MKIIGGLPAYQETDELFSELSRMHFAGRIQGLQVEAGFAPEGPHATLNPKPQTLNPKIDTLALDFKAPQKRSPRPQCHLDPIISRLEPLMLQP